MPRSCPVTMSTPPSTPAERPFDDPTLGQHDEALDLLFIAFDDGDGDTVCFEGGALRLVAVVA